MYVCMYVSKKIHTSILCVLFLLYAIYKMHILQLKSEIKPRFEKKAPKLHPIQELGGLDKHSAKSKYAVGACMIECNIQQILAHFVEPILFFFDQNASSLFQLSNISVSEGCHAMNVASKKPRRLLGREPADASSQKSENINNS